MDYGLEKEERWAVNTAWKNKGGGYEFFSTLLFRRGGRKKDISSEEVLKHQRRRNVFDDVDVAALRL